MSELDLESNTNFGDDDEESRYKNLIGEDDIASALDENNNSAEVEQSVEDEEEAVAYTAHQS